MDNKSKILKNFIENLNDFKIVTEIDGDYQNMGAIIIDGILQSGINYKTVVKPRILNYLKDHSNKKTTPEFKTLIETVPVSQLIKWKESAKTKRIILLTNFLFDKHINTQEDFKKWLSFQENIIELKTLSGIEDKTADYFKILTGHSTNAIDRHLLNFLEKAGITTNDYKEAQMIISQTAKILGVNESYLDHSIWKYMSEL